MKHLTEADLDAAAKANDCGGTCLTPIYKSSTDAPLRWRCFYGHEFDRYISNVRRGYWCTTCADEIKKIKREDVARTYAKDNGFHFVVCEHGLQKTICRFKCANEHPIRRDYIRLTRSTECLTCMNQRRTPTPVEINDKLTTRGIEMVSASYSVISNTATFFCLKDKAHGEWTAVVRSILDGSGCRFCSGVIKHTLIDVHKFTEDKNFRCVSTIYETARKPLEWKCLECGNNWKTTFDKIKNAGTRCPACDGNKPLDITILQTFAKNVRNGICLSPEYTNAAAIYEWKCEEPLHLKFELSWNNVQQKRWCPACGIGKSKGEEELIAFIRSITVDDVTQQFKLSKGHSKSLDGYINALKLGFEYHGLYWHSEACDKDKKYHITKLEETEALGIRLFQFWGHEWTKKQEIVKNIVRMTVGSPCIKLNARDCELKEITARTATPFLEKNHLQGKARSSVYFGLFYKDELVQVLSLRPTRYTGNSSTWEIGRVATLLGHTVRGGFSKLLKVAKAWLVLKGITELYTFADRRYSKGNVYLKNGFEFLGATVPGYYFTKNFTELVHRYTLRKTKDCPEGMTNDAWRKKQGWTKVWDCGQLKFRIKF